MPVRDALKKKAGKERGKCDERSYKIVCTEKYIKVILSTIPPLECGSTSLQVAVERACQIWKKCYRTKSLPNLGHDCIFSSALTHHQLIESPMVYPKLYIFHGGLHEIKGKMPKRSKS